MLYVLFHKNINEPQTFRPFIYAFMENGSQDFENQVHNVSFQYEFEVHVTMHRDKFLIIEPT